jgi:hypothetical protein
LGGGRDNFIDLSFVRWRIVFKSNNTNLPLMTVSQVGCNAFSVNLWSLTIAAQDITETAGVTVTQGSVTGILKTSLTGTGMTSIVIATGAGTTFVTGVDVVVGSTTVAFANIAAAVNTDNTVPTVAMVVDQLQNGNTTSVSIVKGTFKMMFFKF